MGIVSVKESECGYQGGPHQWGETTGFTYNTKTGKKVSLTKVTGKSKKQLKAYVKKQLLKKYSEDLIYGGTDSVDPTKYTYYIKGKYAYVQFNYDLSYYYVGPITVKVPLK